MNAGMKVSAVTSSLEAASQDILLSDCDIKLSYLWKIDNFFMGP